MAAVLGLFRGMRWTVLMVAHHLTAHPNPCRTLPSSQDKPTFIEVMVYGIYWVVIFAMAAYKWYTGSLFDADYK